MFKRLTWFGLGAAAGASGVMWAQQKVRRQIDALGPDHIVVTAGNQARKVSKQVGRSVAGAVVEGRAAMREREDELLARRDGRDVHQWPTASGRTDRRGRNGPSRPDRPTRPARW